MRIAMVEDDENEAEVLKTCIKKYAEEYGIVANVTEFKNGIVFLSDYKNCFDIVFMDIDMPHMNGLEVAKRMREIDPVTVLVFVTNLQQYAVNGYEVEACDYILKPVSYPTFEKRFDKAVKRVRKEDNIVVIKSKDCVVRMDSSKINYVECEYHLCVYNTALGVFKERITMKELEPKLNRFGFSRCNSGCLVNLARVVKTQGNAVIVRAETVSGSETVELPVSRGRKFSFVEDYMRYLGGEG